VRLVPTPLKTNWSSGSQAGPLFLEEVFAKVVTYKLKKCVCVFRASEFLVFFSKVTVLRRMFGVLLLRFFLIAQRVFLRFMLSFFAFCFSWSLFLV
jgi:hypothetical protein